MKSIIVSLSVSLFLASSALSAEIHDSGTLNSYIVYGTNAIAELRKTDPPKKIRVIIIDPDVIDKLRNHLIKPGTEISVNYNEVTGVADSFQQIVGK